MTEQRPYQLERRSREQQFIRTGTEILAVGFGGLNWLATQYAAAMMRHAPYLSGRIIAHVYQPFAWFWWQHRWANNALRIGNHIVLLAPMWRFCEHLVLYPMLVLGAIGSVCALFLMSPRQAADLHGSASWATTPEIQKAGLL